MKRWLPIVAAAFLIGACDNSSDQPPAPKVGADAAGSGSAANDEKLVTGPRGEQQTLPQVATPNASGDSGRDSAATKPKEELTKAQEQNSMPKAGQANNYMSEAMKPGSGGDASSSSQSGAAATDSPQASSSQTGSSGDTTRLAQAGSGGAAAGAAAGGGSAQPVSQEQALALMKKHNCSSCHAVDKKLVGPSYQEVAAKYKGDSGAEAKLIDKVVKGGSGVWGPVPMPPHPTVPKDDVKAIVDWILAGAT